MDFLQSASLAQPNQRLPLCWDARLCWGRIRDKGLGSGTVIGTGTLTPTLSRGERGLTTVRGGCCCVALSDSYANAFAWLRSTGAA